MTDKLSTRNGETIPIDQMIEALERTPDSGEILQALKDLRRDKVKRALGESVKAAQFDRDQVFDEFLADGEKSERTKKTYQDECRRLFSWLARVGLHTLQVRRADVNRFKSYLSEKYSPNTVRLTLSAGSSFYSYLEAERYIEHSPFSHIKYPKRVYKKAVRPDQGSPVPVMSEDEYKSIIGALERRASMPVRMIWEERIRDSARRILPAVHFMAEYGLRVGDLLTVRIEDEERFSFRQKGGRVIQKALKPHTTDLLTRFGIVKRSPFQGIAKSTLQGAVRRLTLELAAKGAIRHAYSAHDFRHYFAVELYRECGDIYAVKEALGHASIQVTEVYLSGLGAKG